MIDDVHLNLSTKVNIVESIQNLKVAWILDNFYLGSRMFIYGTVERLGQKYYYM